MRFIRCSEGPVSGVHATHQDETEDRGSKPNGAWFSVVGEDGRDGWKDHCKATGKTLQPYRTELFLHQDAILWVRTDAEIDTLTNKYGYFPPVPGGLPKFLRSKSLYSRSAICWKRLASKYDGIVIAPWCAERGGQQTLWYSTWDCASGCVWSERAVKKWGPSVLWKCDA